ncbi:MAG: RES family NAD+ phosphorylase [Deltaproteobacteria bacterium]|nr:RES family NAD+ phosphorylase [Deltaproteobacteria bacterium]
MRVWRICSKSHQAFDGAGARRYGGRWNRPGTSVVYTSGSLSLAALEYFVHVDPDIAPDHLIAISADIPDSIEVESIEIANLPSDWRRYPAPEALQDIGTAWVKRGSTPVLAIPSALIPHERNYLINPAHRDFRRIRVNKPAPFHFDPRMWK